MENRFDDLTKALAEGIPRRQALRRLAGLFGGALLGALTFGSTARANGCGPGEFKCNGGCCSKAFYNCCNGGCSVTCGKKGVCCSAGDVCCPTPGVIGGDVCCPAALCSPYLGCGVGPA